jgi:hypothetical protein
MAVGGGIGCIVAAEEGGMADQSGLAKQSRTAPLSGPVLVATDLTPGSDDAFRQANALARDLGGPLHACHVLPDLLTARMLFPHVQQRDDAAVQDLERHAGDLVEVALGLPCSTASSSGPWPRRHTGAPMRWFRPSAPRS